MHGNDLLISNVLSVQNFNFCFFE